MFHDEGQGLVGYALLLLLLLLLVAIIVATIGGNAEDGRGVVWQLWDAVRAGSILSAPGQ